MPSHVCNKEKEIDMINKAVFNSGHGLIQNVATILTKVDNIEKTLVDLQTGLSGLMKFQAEVLTEKKVVEKRRLNSWQITSILGSLILSLGGIIAAIIFKS